MMMVTIIIIMMMTACSSKRHSTQHHQLTYPKSVEVDIRIVHTHHTSHQTATAIVWHCWRLREEWMWLNWCTNSCNATVSVCQSMFKASSSTILFATWTLDNRMHNAIHRVQLHVQSMQWNNYAGGRSMVNTSLCQHTSLRKNTHIIENETAEDRDNKDDGDEHNDLIISRHRAHTSSIESNRYDSCVRPLNTPLGRDVIALLFK